MISLYHFSSEMSLDKNFSERKVTFALVILKYL